MPENIVTEEDYFASPLSWSDFVEEYQEETVSVSQIRIPDTEYRLNIQKEVTIDTLTLQNSYPYLILPKDSNTTTDDFSNWQIAFDFNEYFSNQPIREKTFFAKEIEWIPIHRGIQAKIWFTPLLFLMFVCYGLIFFRKKKALLQDFKELFTFSFRNEVFKKDSFVDNSQSRISLVISGIVNISLFSFFAVTRLLNHDTKHFTLILFLLLIMTILYILFKIAITKLIYYVFFDKSLFAIWQKTFYSFILFLGISLIPIVLCLSFGPTMWITPIIYIGLFFCICFSILYLSKITLFFLQGAPSLFYLILYLCTLEILPTLIFLRELINVITTV